MGNHYLQKVGLPMGGCLSGTLANIYLATLEQNIITQHTDDILYYTHYMDDILIIHTGPLQKIHQLLHDMQHIFQLQLTHNITNLQTPFLDLTISYSPNTNITTSLFSKNHQLLKFPLPSDHRSHKQVLHLTRAQLIRFWRVSLNSSKFTQQIHYILDTLVKNSLHPIISHTIDMFLKPVQLEDNSWSHTFLLCSTCTNLVNTNNILLTKSLFLAPHYVTSTHPASCHTPNLLLLIHSPPLIQTYFTGPNTIHNIIEKIQPFSLLLPYCQYKSSKLSTFIQKHHLQSFLPSDNITQNINTFPCFLHTVTDNISSVYNIPSSSRAKSTITNFFNSYKTISRK
jgi:hypothetical protein